MARMIFINLPVEDVARSADFYTALGFQKNPQFSGEQAASMQWTDSVVVGLLAKPMFATFTPKRIIDAQQEVGALFALGLDSREEVDAITAAAVAAGGTELHGAEDHGFMYSRAFADPDGHGWGPFHMDVAAHAAAMSEAEGA